MKQITKQNQIELKAAINDITSTIMEHDHNEIIKILSEVHRDMLNSSKYVDKNVLVEKGKIILDLMYCIAEYGRVQTNIFINEHIKD